MLKTIRSGTAMRRGAVLAAAMAVAWALAGCGHSGHDMPGMDHPASAMPDHTGMPGMDNDTPAGDGLAASVAGFRLAPAATALTAGQPGTIRFQIFGPDGRPVATFADD